MENFAIPNAAFIGSALAVCFLLANAKSLPFSHSLRLLPSLYRLLRPRLFPTASAQRPPISGAATAQTALFKHHVTSSRAVLLDLDINMHKSNSTFFADADINRAELLTTLLSQGLAAAGPAAGASRPTTAAIPLLAAVQCIFKREIGPFQPYQLSSRILAWDDKSLFFVTYFVKPGTRLTPDVELTGGPELVLKDAKLRRCVYAVMVTRYVCKAGRETVAPAAVLEAAGLLLQTATASGWESHAALLPSDRLEQVLESGMQYVGSCMA